MRFYQRMCQALKYGKHALQKNNAFVVLLICSQFGALGHLQGARLLHRTYSQVSIDQSTVKKERVLL